MEEITTSENSNLQLTAESQSFLRETAKWAYFLSILGFVGIGFLLFLAMFMGTIFSKLGVFGGGFNSMPMMGVGFITFIYLILAVIYFFPVYYLFQFASKAKAAFNSNDNERLTSSLEYLKSHYKFMGILAIVMFSFYGVIFLGSFIGILFASFR
ncbi:MAG: hypothetical protein RLZZ540_185 [Bacteroidota bacterium]|jgi:uncharacterized membrane protein